MLIDLHVHTSDFSPCAASSADEIVARAVEMQLDGPVLTDHFTIWPRVRFEILQRSHPETRLFRGIEEGDLEGHDSLVKGVTDPAVFSCRRPAGELIQVVHDHGGAIVLAHPFRYGPSLPAAIHEQPVDAIEMKRSNNVSSNRVLIQALKQELDVGGVAGSDAHHVNVLGRYATRFGKPIVDEKELAAVIRSQACAIFEA